MSKQRLIPPFGQRVHLADYDPGYTGNFMHKEDVHDQLARDLARLSELQELFYADRQHALLIVLQGIDTGGKDGTIEHVFSGVNPQGVLVTAFKQPTPEELAHDFLWRVHRNVPLKGFIGIFNRSHYEEVLVVRVHELVPKKVWKERYERINQFEAMLAANSVTILKFFLYISKDEQKKRFENRLSDPKKQWKFAMGDLEERKRWDDYMAAYEDMLTKCNTEVAPWYVVPANHKWYRNYVVTQTVIHTLESMNLKYPKPAEGIENAVIPD